MFLKVMF